MITATLSERFVIVNIVTNLGNHNSDVTLTKLLRKSSQINLHLNHILSVAGIAPSV
jgi:hypothetical protein